MIIPRVDGGFVPLASDRIHGPLWVVFGAAVTAGALRIDRLDAQGVEWFAAPGLLPAILGIFMALSGVLIAVRAWRSAELARAAPAEADPGEWRRVSITLLLCLGFAAGVVGRGLPFGVAAALYLFAHITLLQWPERRAAGTTLRGLAVAAAIAVGTGLAVPFVFEQLFLVRLP